MVEPKQISHYFLNINKNTILLHRFINTWESLIHLIPISKVEDMEFTVRPSNL